MAKKAGTTKRWNEHVRLIVSFFNLTSVGVFGLGIVAPLMDQNNPLFFYWSAGIDKKLNLSKDFHFYDVISWQAILTLVSLHIFAHVLIGFIDQEG